MMTTRSSCSFVVLVSIVSIVSLRTWATANQPKYQQNRFSAQSDQGTVPPDRNEIGDSPNLKYQLKSAVREIIASDFNLTRRGRNYDPLESAESLLGSYSLNDEAEFPVHEPTGPKTRKTYDFTRTYHVGLSCHDIQATQGAKSSGVYLIHPPNLAQGPWRVFCDLETEGGGWMVFQVRDDVEPRENFMRGWEDYKVGFGDFDREFWLGNILIWALTNVDNETKYELAIDLEDWSSNRRFARYRSFRLGGERDSFRLYHQNLFYGNAGDSLYSHNGLPFSTFDVDNDNREGDFADRSCARLYKGGWWYGNCHDSNLNGWNLAGPHRSFADGINWYTWTGYNYSLKKTVMKIRPQVSGPIDIGYGNYVLTAPPDAGIGVGDEVDDHHRHHKQFNGGQRQQQHQRHGSHHRMSKDLKEDIVMNASKDQRVDVSELLSTSNTLTNPDNYENKKRSRRSLSRSDEL